MMIDGEQVDHQRRPGRANGGERRAGSSAPRSRPYSGLLAVGEQAHDQDHAARRDGLVEIREALGERASSSVGALGRRRAG